MPALAGKATVSPEVYPAIVGPVSTSTIESIGPAVANPEKVITPKPLPPSTYEAVPGDQVDALVFRLSIVRSLIERHGRAYDYRYRTIDELKQLLDDLDTNTLQGL